MKKLFYLGITCFIFTSCSTGSTKTETTAIAADTVATTQEPKESEAVGIWDKISVRETPSEEGKWLTSLSLGEKLTFLNKDAKDKNGKIYYQVRLNDGTKGWIRHEFIVPDAKPGVFQHDSDIYTRPDLLTKSDIQFRKMDIVAIGNLQDDWVEITGKRTDGKWIDKGWVKASNLSTDQVDIAIAKFAQQALEAGTSADKIEKLEEIVQNSDLSGSIFSEDIKQALDKLKMAEMEVKYEIDPKRDTISAESEI